MHSAVKIEANWRLLFDIALGYGESVSMLKLTYPGFMNFLQATELLSVKTGVYPVLIEKLWNHHAILSPSNGDGDMFDDSITCLDQPRLNKRQPSYDVKRHEVMKLGVCGFEGFTDMMNVICVRSYQSRKCMDLYVKDQESLAQAILLSAEDVVTLPESVKYTAQKYFKSFISRNVVRRSTKLLLDPMVNEWTKHTNAIVTHIIGSLLDTVVLPLFRLYSKKGLMYQKHFYRLVDGLFHSFTPAQKAAAASIFTCEDFFDVRNLLKSSRIPVNDTDLTDKPTLSFESFVEALMMLGIVAFSDENQFPHYRSITAKVWFVFENVYCRTAGRIAMAEEPIFTGNFASIKPVISFAYPHYVPIEQVTSFLISGLNLTPYQPVSVENINNNDPLAPLIAGRLIQPEKEESEASVQEDNSVHEDSLLFSTNISPMLAPPALENPEDGAGAADEGAQAVTETDKSAPQGKPAAPTTGGNDTATTNANNNGNANEEAMEDAAERSSDGGRPGHGKEEAPRPSSHGRIGVTDVAATAMKLGNQEFEAREYSQFDSPVYGIRVSRVFVNDVCAYTIDHGKNYVEVLLPPIFTEIQNFRMSVRLEENVTVRARGLDAETVISRFVFLPVQRISVSVRNKDGNVTYSSVELLLHTTPVFQVIPNTQLESLRRTFCESAEKHPIKGVERLPRSQFMPICKKLGLVSAGKAMVACQSAIQNYFSVSRECDPTTLGIEKNPLQMDELRLPDWLSFSDFMCVIAQLCIRQAGTTTDVPNVVNFVSAAMASKSDEVMMSASASRTTEQAVSLTHVDAHSQTSLGTHLAAHSTLPTIPYNSLIEVPYENAIKKKCRHVAESTDAADAFLTNIQVFGAEKLRTNRGVRELPPFPSDVAVESAVSQYEGDEAAGLAKDILQVSKQIQEEFMLEEIVINTNSPK